MIDVKVSRDSKEQIVSVTVTGHAQYADKGQDIVCAAVSAITFGMINATEFLLHQELDVDINEKEGGYLRCQLPHHLSPEVKEKMLFLLEAMVASLVSVEDEYGQYVRIHDSKYEGGERPC